MRVHPIDNCCLVLPKRQASSCVFAPVVLIFRMLGVDLQKQLEPTQFSLLKTLFKGVVLMVYCAGIFDVLNTAYVASKQPKALDVIRILCVDVVSCVSGYVTGIWMLLKYHKLVEFWQHLTSAISCAHLNLNDSNVSLRRKILVVVIVAFILWLVPIVGLIVVYYTVSQAVSKGDYNIDEKYYVFYTAVFRNNNVAGVMYMIFGFMFLMYPLPLLLACNTLYCVVCLLLTSLLETTGKYGRSLLAIQQRHDTICKLVVDADDIFADMVAVWYFFEILALVFNFRNAVASWGPSIIRGTHIVVATSVLTISKIFLSSQVNTLVRDSLFNPFLRNILTMEDNEVEVEIYSLYCSSISLNMPGLTAWKFFYVHRGFFVTVIGAIVTYSVIMFDL